MAGAGQQGGQMTAHQLQGKVDGAFTAAAGVGRPDLGPLFVGEQGQIEGTGDMGKGELAGRADIQQRDALVPHGQKCGNVLNWGHDDPLKSKKSLLWVRQSRDAVNRVPSRRYRTRP